MHRNLHTDDVLRINNDVYDIISVIGEGASSTVYFAKEEKTGHLHVIKEYNPKMIDVDRDESGSFVVSMLDKNTASKYNFGKKRFLEAAKKQITIRNNYSGMMNNTFIVNWIMEANNTAYIGMPTFEGESYDKVGAEASLQELLVHIKAIALAVKTYHDNGFLHLDIKPANTYFLVNSDDFVMLFDFDSVIEKAKLFEADVILSYSSDWASPEQCNYRYHSLISERSDIFSIGEILFYRLFGRHSTIREKRRFSEYDYSSVEYFKNVNKRVKDILSDVFHKTLSINVNHRYKCCDELVSDIEKALQYAAPHQKYLVSSNILPSAVFVGRDKLLEQAYEILDDSSTVVLNGMGGMGKTELAIQFAYKYSAEFNDIVFINGASNWLDLVNTYVYKYIANIEQDDFYEQSRDQEELFDRLIILLQTIVTQKTLFIIDNIDQSWFFTEEYKIGKQFLDLNCKFLFTSRSSSDLFPSLEVGSINEEGLVDLFIHWSNDSTGDTKNILNIIKHIGSHTLTVELIAKQMKNEGITPEEKYNQIIEKGLPNIKGNVVSQKDREIKRNAVFAHLVDLFSFSDLTVDKRSILLAGALIPISGLNRRDFNYISGNQDGDIVGELVESGWIKIREKITVHPLISEVILGTQYEERNLDAVLERIINLCADKGLSNDFANNFELRELVKSCFLKCNKSLCKSNAYQSFLLFDYSNILNITERLDILIDAERLFGESLEKEKLLDLYLRFAKCYSDLYEYNEADPYINKIFLLSNNEYQFRKYRLEAKVLLANKEYTAYNWDVAIPLYLQLVEDYNQYGDEFIIEIGNVYYYLMICYYCKGDFDLTREYLEKSRKERKKVFQSTDNALLDLDIYEGKLYIVSKEYEKAEQRLLQIIEKSKCKESVNITYYIMDLVYLYFAIKKIDKIPDLLNKCYEIRTEYYPENHTDIATIYEEWMKYYGYMADWERSNEYFEKAYEIYEIHFGSEADQLSDLLYYNGNIHCKMGKYAEAIVLLKKSLEISENKYIEYNQSYNAMAYQFLGDAYMGLNKYPDAEVYYKKALAIYQKEEMQEDIDEVMDSLKKISECNT